MFANGVNPTPSRPSSRQPSGMADMPLAGRAPSRQQSVNSDVRDITFSFSFHSIKVFSDSLAFIVNFYYTKFNSLSQAQGPFSDATPISRPSSSRRPCVIADSSPSSSTSSQVG